MNAEATGVVLHLPPRVIAECWKLLRQLNSVNHMVDVEEFRRSARNLWTYYVEVLVEVVLVLLEVVLVHVVEVVVEVVLVVLVVVVVVVPTMTLPLQDYAMYRGMTANMHFLCAHTADWIQ